jgi:hypothetical protein
LWHQKMDCLIYKHPIVGGIGIITTRGNKLVYCIINSVFSY